MQKFNFWYYSATLLQLSQPLEKQLDLVADVAAARNRVTEWFHRQPLNLIWVPRLNAVPQPV